jgi:hypothetical protein
MKKLLLALLLAASPAMAEPTKGYNTYDAMGCMILRECTDGVVQVRTMLDISSTYNDINSFMPVTQEFNDMLMSLNQIGVKVYLADQKYFPVGHRGVYHTVSNNFYLNKAYMHRPHVLMSVMRHEGWHAAQDCMAGSIDNSMIAIIKNEEDVPKMWREMVEKIYPKSAVPWEAEATWAGKTEGMTQKALEACAAGNMWEVYPPTPLTRAWLEAEGFIK